MSAHIRFISWVFCILFLVSGCSFSSAFDNHTSSLLSTSAVTLAPAKQTSQGKAKVDVKSAKFKIMHAYQFKVSKRDGVDEDEAIIIAQSEIIFRGFEDDYYFTKPRLIMMDKESWGVEFYPISKTFREARTKPRIQISVNKANGKLAVSLVGNTD